MNNNMEDRLRQAFETEAEQLNTPPGSLETTIRRGQRRRASTMIGGAALAVALIGGAAVGFQVAQDGPDPDPDRSPIAAAETTTADETSDTIPSATGDEIPITETFIWEQVDLPVPAGTSVFDVRVASIDGKLLAIGQSFASSDVGGPTLTVWESEDGRTWETIPSPGDFGDGLDNVFSSAEGILLVGRGAGEAPQGEARTETLTLLTSQDGRNWQRGTVEFALESNEFAWVPSATIGDGVYLVAATVNAEPPQPPIVLDEAGITIEQDNGLATATLLDTATGAVLAEVPMDVIYGYSSEGPTLYDDAGNEIAVIPGEVMSLAYENARLEAGSEFEFPEQLVVEHEGIRISLNQIEYTYTAEDIATGEIIASGNQDELYRPPRFVITDPASGEVLVDMEWEDFWEAQDRSYSRYDPEFEHRARTLLFRSTDGSTWEQVESPIAGASGEVMGLAYGPAGFVLSILTEPTGPTVWNSEDGRSWSELAGRAEFDIGSTVAADDDYFYSVNGSGNSYGVARSEDFMDWETRFELNRSTWFNHLAAGELGVVAVGESNNYVEPDITITKDGKTLLLAAAEGAATVTDDATGEVLASIVFDPYTEEPPEGIVLLEDDSGFEVLGDDGSVVMTITNEDMMESRPTVEPEFQAPDQVVLFSPDGAEWARVSTGGLDLGYVSGVAVGTDAVIIAGEPSYIYEERFAQSAAGDTTVVTSVSAGESPVPTVWVGRPA